MLSQRFADSPYGDADADCDEGISSSSFEAENAALNTVALGYLNGAQPYRQHKDASLLDVAMLQVWTQSLVATGADGVVVDLGCASGYPLAAHLLGLRLDYLGVDLCARQIQLARSEHPQHAERFLVQEMLQYVLAAPPRSLLGVAALYSVVHLPRLVHARLFAGILRALRPAGTLLVTVAAESGEAYHDAWLGVTMFWSQFSPAWYELTLVELGFQLVAKQFTEKQCLGESEPVWFMMFRKPCEETLEAAPPNS